jgi:hypothetical protein
MGHAAPRLDHLTAAVLCICIPLNTFVVFSAEGANKEQEGELKNDEVIRGDFPSRTVIRASLSNAGGPGIARDDEAPTLLELARSLPSFKQYLPSLPATRPSMSPLKRVSR